MQPTKAKELLLWNWNANYKRRLKFVTNETRLA
jgi:hypothetical protein